LAFVTLVAVFLVVVGADFFVLVVDAVTFLGEDLVVLVTVAFFGEVLEDVVVVLLVVEVLVPDDLALVVVAALVFVVAALVLVVVALGFVVVAVAFLVVVVLGAGLVSFSLVTVGLGFLGASLTLPETPLGMKKIPFSTPVLIERAICELTRASTSILYVCSR